MEQKRRRKVELVSEEEFNENNEEGEIEFAKREMMETEGISRSPVSSEPYNSRYALLVNRELTEFLTALPVDDPIHLDSSHISIEESVEIEEKSDRNSKKRRKRRRKASQLSADDQHDDLVDSNISGVLWTKQEKEKFFHLLGRKSRHNLNAVARELGSKSLLECEEYHDLLFSCSIDAPPLNLVDFPAANEMSDDWVTMENNQSSGIELYEELRLREQLGVNTKGSILDDEETEQPQQSEEDNEQETPILRTSELLCLALIHYSVAHSSEEEEGFENLDLGLSLDCVTHLEEFTRDLIIFITRTIFKFKLGILRTALSPVVSSKQQLKLEVTPQDIYAVVERLTLPHNLVQYWKGLEKSICNGSMPNNDGEIAEILLEHDQSASENEVSGSASLTTSPSIVEESDDALRWSSLDPSISPESAADESSDESSNDEFSDETSESGDDESTTDVNFSNKRIIDVEASQLERYDMETARNEEDSLTQWLLSGEVSSENILEQQIITDNLDDKSTSEGETEQKQEDDTVVSDREQYSPSLPVVPDPLPEEILRKIRTSSPFTIFI